jgi:uncharacterized repeat protein (TIGR01451 family)
MSLINTYVNNSEINNKKRKKKTYIFLIIAVLLIAVLLPAIGFQMINTPTSPKAENPIIDDETTTEYIDEIQPEDETPNNLLNNNDENIGDDNFEKNQNESADDGNDQPLNEDNNQTGENETGGGLIPPNNGGPGDQNDVGDGTTDCYINLPDTAVTVNVEYILTDSYFNITLSNVPAGYDVSNDNYLGWCIDLGTPINTSSIQELLYSSYCPPDLLEDTSENWSAINYILNNKPVDENYWDIQTAIWYFINFGNQTIPPTTNAWIMINDALENGTDFIPSGGDVISVICKPEIDESNFQLVIIEVLLTPPEPDIELIKNANVSDAQIGDTITYTYRVTNTGELTLINISLIDDLLGSIILNETELSPGEYAVGTATHTVEEYDLPGPIVNTANASGEDPFEIIVYDIDSETVNLSYNACIDLLKEADLTSVYIGDSITYNYTVTNCGNVNLIDIIIEDDLLGTITLNTTVLQPGEWAFGTATYIVTEIDLPGPIVNIANASGYDIIGNLVSDLDTVSIIIINPNIDLEKTANIQSAAIGETITYTYIVYNIGDVTLTSINLIDDILGTIIINNTELAPGEYAVGIATHTVEESDLPGPIVNIANASGEDPFEIIVYDVDTETVSIEYNADIEIIKEADLLIADIGDIINYTYTVTNIGEVTLTDITVYDDLLGPITLGTNELTPGESTTGTSTHLVSENDLPGPIENIAAVTGYDPLIGYVEDSDFESVDIIYNAIIQLIKEADISEAYIGDIITYSYTVTNIGDVTIYDLTVFDDLLGYVTLNDNILSPGESTTGLSTHIVSENDLPGPIENIATATGYDPVGYFVEDFDDEIVTVLVNAEIDILKEADVTNANVDDTITYSYTVTNIGDVTLYINEVYDDKLGYVTLDTTIIAPQDSASGTLYYTVDCDDIPEIINIVTVDAITGWGIPVTDSDDENVIIDFNPDISVEKYVFNLTSGSWEKGVVITEGEDLLFSIIIHNNGDEQLENVVVIDGLPIFLRYNEDANPIPDSYSDHQMQWNIGLLNVDETIYVTYSALAIGNGNDDNVAQASAESCSYVVSDNDYTNIIAVPCPPIVYVDDDWASQDDVDFYNSALTWQYDAYNNIQQAVDIVCDCGIVYVLEGIYEEQVLINKNIALQGAGYETTKIILPTNYNTYTIEDQPEIFIPIILAYGGELIGNTVIGTESIGVSVDGFELNGSNITNSIGIVYHNVETNCIPSIISNNYITFLDIAISINGCSGDTTIIHNRIVWTYAAMNKIGIEIEESNNCEPINVEIHHNFIGIACGQNIGVYNKVSDIANSTYNWWGAPDGPSSPEDSDNYDVITGRIANGNGEKVIGLVHFDPWAGIEANATITHYDDSYFVFCDASDSFSYHINGSENTINTYKWNFGDGQYSFDMIDSHLYSNPGTYTIILQVWASDLELQTTNLFDEIKFTVTIP